MQPLLDPDSPVDNPAEATCAVFYSITNCQEGLRGISFGNLLIKQVAEDLKREFPHLRRFATLSPVPGFRRWLGEHAGPELLKKIEDPAWHLGEVPEAVQAQLTRLCARYLLHAEQGDEPLDPVARFHLGNGARLERLNWLADTSDNGLGQSYGVMVNYLYNLDDIEKNHEAYAEGRAIVAANAVKRLVRKAATELVPAAG